MSQLRDRLQRALGDRYTVERELGAGGMAIVFAAQDNKHNRLVAIKVLRPELAATLGSERFLLEIEIAARLQHPHILPLYDSGSAEGVLYYVMPYVEGESVADCLKRDGPLPVDHAVRIAAEVASALEYAHRQGVVHRDIKPANIMISGGHAIVADFGIARAISASADAADGLTQAGTTLGTPAYMSPEQATGSAEEIDGRSDVYSLGCVLFEMLGGRVPYTGSSYQAILTQIITGEIPAIRKVRPEVPVWLDSVVATALAKDPDSRFQSAQEMAEALASRIPTRRESMLRRAAVPLLAVMVVVLGFLWWTSRPEAAVEADAEVIAVIPFTTSGPNVEFLGEGMVDLMSANLNGVGGVRTVDPRTILYRFRERARNGTVDLEGALSIGRDVEAGSVLLGSVVSTGTGVRLRAELYSMDGEQMFAASVTGAQDSVLSLVDSLSLGLMREVWRSQEPVPQFRVAAVTTGSLEAVREYLAGERFYRSSQWDSAIAHLTRAAEIDTTFALAQLKLALAHGWAQGQGAGHGALADSLSRAAVRNVDRLPDRERLLVVANQLRSEGRIETIDSLEAYVARYPDDVEGLFMLADARHHAQPILGRSTDERFNDFDRVLRLDSSLTPALIHPLELSIILADSARFFRYAGLVADDSGTPSSSLYLRLGRRIWTGDDELDREAINQIAESPVQRFTASALAVLTGELSPDSVQAIAREVSPAVDEAQRLNVEQSAIGLLLGTGRYSEGLRLLDSLTARAGAGQAAFTELFFRMFGYPNFEIREEAAELIENVPVTANPIVSFLLASGALREGDLDGFVSIASAVDTTGAGWSAEQRAAWRGVVGWSQVIRGDTAAGLNRMRTAIREIGFSTPTFFQSQPMRYWFARMAAAYEPTRAEGLRLLKYDDLLLRNATHVMLDAAEVMESMGDYEGAAVSYARFLNLWEGADPELQPLLDNVREALERVTAERTGA